MSTPVANQYSERYRKLADGELLMLARQREQLAATASAALDAELAARGLGPEAIREFEHQVQRNPEPETPDASEQLPAPNELPDDWFIDDPEDRPSSLSSSRPKGVTVCAFVFWLSGLAATVWGVLIVSGNLSSRLWVTGVITMILGLAQCVVGSGLWKLTPWARRSAAAFCWFCFALASFDILAGAYMKLRGFAVDPMHAIGEFMGLWWQLLWALYLGRQSTREAFLAVGQKGGT